MGVIGSGSDHYSFVAKAAVPIISMSYETVTDAGSNPLYHSMYEVPWTVDSIVDVDYKVLKAITQVSVELMRALLTEPIVELDLKGYADALPAAV